jgi:hypothetical protein
MLTRQTRTTFDPVAVLEFLKTCPHGGEAPQQGWISLVDEACHRIAALEIALTAMATSNRQLMDHTEHLMKTVSVPFRGADGTGA